MALEGDVSITGLARAEKNPQLADAENVSTGVETTFESTAAKIVLFLDVAGAIDITVELTPDSGSTWFEPNDGALPLSFSSADDDVVVLNYSATGIRITGSNGTAVTAEVLARA